MPSYHPVIRSDIPAQASRQLGTMGMCLAVTLACIGLKAAFQDVHVELPLLSCVVVVSALWGRAPGITAAVLMATSYDWFFLPPHRSFHVSGAHLLSLVLLLGIALLVGHLAARLRSEAEQARRGQGRAQATTALARDLAGAMTSEHVLSLARPRFEATLGQVPSFVLDTSDPALSPAGAVCIPMRAPRKVRGFLVLQTPLAHGEDQDLLETWASLLALALERIHFVEVAREALLRMEGEKLRGHILATLSHDLRTPLTGLLAGAQRLHQELESTAQPDLAGQAQDLVAEAGRMSDLVGNLLELSRLQSGGVQLRWDWNSAQELCASALRHRQAVLEGRSVAVDIPEDLPPFWCDGTLVERVLVNFLDNAARHTPEGTGLRLWAHREGRTVRLGLDDQGGGFPAEESARDAGRGGIGLSLCRAIAKAHGARLRLESRPEGGARVVLELSQDREMPPMPSEPEGA
jgi:two-component system sensor histidine kinase KdpD